MSPPLPADYRRRELFIILFMLTLFGIGVFLSIAKVGDDEAWLARAGGIMTIASVYFTAPAALARQRLLAAEQAARGMLASALPQVEREHGAAVASTVQHETENEISNVLGQSHAGIRRMEVFILVASTLVWALGDLIKFPRAWMVAKGMLV